MPATRQLAAILFADIQGYTALMQEDEAKARVIRDKFKKELENEIPIHQGRLIQFSGDGALCIFNSAIEAVRAAIGIQKRMQGEPKVPLRIGIHSGDVMFEEENIYGDGVNIASRIESFAVPGSVFISGKVYDEIKNQKDIEAISLGKFKLKNVNVPVEIFGIKGEGLMIPTDETLAGKGHPVADKQPSFKRFLITAGTIIIGIVVAVFLYELFFPPTSTYSGLKTIAVLPFANLSSQQDDEYFTDGMCDEVLTQLSKIGSLNVISRTSTLQFKGTKKTMKEIGKQIGADVLLEGSVQKSNDKIRINVQLIDARNDRHLWAETYDRELKDVFAIQTDIAKQIAEALNTTLTEKEKSLFEEKPTDNLQAYDLYLKGNKYAETFLFTSKLDQVDNAVRMYEQAIKLDPKFLEAYRALIELYTEISWRKSVINSEEYLVIAKEWLDKMVALNIDQPIMHLTLATYKYEGARDYAGALAELDIADEMLGNRKSTNTIRAVVLRRLGRIDEALTLLLNQAETFPKEAIVQSLVTESYMMKRDFNGALQHANKTMELESDQVGVYWQKAILYSDMKGDVAGASAVLEDAAAVVDTNLLKDVYIHLEMLKGNYEGAIRRLLLYPDSIYILSQSKIVPAALPIAILYELKGDAAQSKVYFQKAQVIMMNLLQQYPDDFRVYASLGIAMAGLGEKEKALVEANKAVAMMPVSTDAIIGIAPLEDLALIHVLNGEQDAAIDILEQLLKMPFGWDTTNTIPLLKIHPYWKPLQNNPRFQKMIR
ncbi:MAG TPA: adenylate/guanylate cyclase domain-containing protein [Chitinophagales bacterium]|nr:adenylate/guanylate cyclase domain-containing protein [Chitinophagales bacterium]